MKALALFSGGLDSMIAMKLITSQGINVTALNMNIGFGGTKDMSATFRARAKMVGADFEVVDVRQRYIDEILFAPKHGYGKRFNPCIDCHGFMFKVAKELLSVHDANFIITGEVVGQRPMSQNKNALNSVLGLAGDADNIILRPMSAKLLPLTKPELECWVDREKLLDIQGRDRKRQLSLAAEFGFSEYQNPGGGCLLTDINFSQKVKEFVKYQPLHVNDIALLKVGKHFRLEGGAKFIFGRDEAENSTIENIKHDDFVDVSLGEDLPAPSGKISKNATKSDKELACKIFLAHTKLDKNRPHEVKVGDEIISEISLKDKNEAKIFAIGI
ncbi:MAG: argininosuccinate synthase domain-containing protein [Campylobacteraceae bacterium]